MSEAQPTRSVRGQVVVPPADVPAEAAEFVVRLEDVSRADAPSVVIAEHRQHHVLLEAGSTVPFTLEVPADRVDPSSLYSLSAHIDASGSGEVEPGDLISTRSYPVLTRGYGDEATVEVQRVQARTRKLPADATGVIDRHRFRAAFLILAAALLSWPIEPLALSFRAVELVGVAGAALGAGLVLAPKRSVVPAALEGAYIVLAVRRRRAPGVRESLLASLVQARVATSA